MNADKIVRALETEVLCENCPHNESNCPDDGCYYIMAAALIDKLQALAENGQSAIDTNMRLVKVVESLQAELAESKRREQAAVEDMKIIADTYREKNCDDGICGLCKFDADHGLDGDANECPGFETDGCFEWRGPQEAGEGETE